MISLAVAPISLAMRSRDDLDGFFRGPSEWMVAAGGVAELLDEIRQHLFQHARIHRRGRVVVHVNGQLDSIRESSAVRIPACWGSPSSYSLIPFSSYQFKRLMRR